MITNDDLRRRLAAYQSGQADALCLAVWACESVSSLHCHFVARADSVALAFFLELICQEGPTFEYTYNAAAFRSLVADITAALDGTRAWKETLHEHVSGSILLNAVPGSAADAVLAKATHVDIQRDRMYQIEYEIEILLDTFNVVRASLTTA